MLNRLHNLVVSNKNKIRQVCIQTINKSVQKLRKLKILMDKKPEVSNIKVKLRKNTQIIEELKKLKPVDAIKSVLLFEKSPTTVITNGLSTPEEIAVALLCQHKVMLELLKQFRTALDIKENDESWKEEILRVSKRKQKISRTEIKRQKRKKLKERKQLEQKREEWLVENTNGAAVANINEKSNDSNANEEIISKVGTWKVEKIEKPTKKILEKPTKKVVVKTSKKINEKHLKNTDANQTATNKTTMKPEKTAKKPQKTKTHTIIENQNETNLAETTKIKFNFDEESPKDESEADAEITHVVDPFFITEDGDFYLSTALIKSDNQENNSDPASKNLFKTNMFKSLDDKNLNFKSKSNQFRSNSFSTYDNKISYTDRSLKAETDGNFKNKKVRFNEGGNPISVNKKFTSSKNDDNAEKSLHPSWIAKQKLKPTIAAFQGKKITFDDDI